MARRSFQLAGAIVKVEPCSTFAVKSVSVETRYPRLENNNCRLVQSTSVPSRFSKYWNSWLFIKYINPLGVDSIS